MSKAIRIATELLTALLRKDIKMACEYADELKKLMDTYKISC